MTRRFCAYCTFCRLVWSAGTFLNEDRISLLEQLLCCPALQKDFEETGHITPPFCPAGHPLPTPDALVLGWVGRRGLSNPHQEPSWLPASWRTWLFITRSSLGNIVHNSVAMTRRHVCFDLGPGETIHYPERSGAGGC